MQSEDAGSATGHTDETLVERVQHGDGAAFDKLFERYFGPIHRFVQRRLGSSADVEATVEEVFSDLFSSLDGFRGEVTFSAWVFGLTRRALQRLGRRN